MFASNSFAWYEISSAGSSVENAPELETKPTEEVLWKVGNTSNHYVKISAGNTVQYKALYVSGGAGNNHDMIVAMGDGSVLELSAGKVTYNNSNSKAWETYAFETINDTDKATVNLTATGTSEFALAYHNDNLPFPVDGKRGVTIGKGITLSSLGDINVTDNLVNTGGDFIVNGDVIVGENGAKSFTAKDARVTQAADSTIKATSIKIENTTDTKRDAVFGGNVVADTITIKNANVSLSSLTALTADARANIELAGGVSTLSTTSADVLASSRILDASNTSSNLTIGNDMTVWKIYAPKSKIFVDTGIKLIVGDGTDGHSFNVGGTIKGTVTVNNTSRSDGGDNFIESDLTIDGGKLISAENSNTYYNLTARNATITVKNGGSVDLTNGFLAITNGGKYVFDDATSKLNAIKVMMGNSNSGDSTLEFASTSNFSEGFSFLVRDTNKVAKLILAKDTSAYKFGSISFLRVSNMTVDLNGASVEFSSVNRYNSAGSTSTLIFEDFANGLVKFTDNLSVADDGKVLGLNDNTSITISGVTTDGTSLTSGWSIRDGYLFNSQLVVPEPAEWAAIFGAIALGLAIYRRRK